MSRDGRWVLLGAIIGGLVIVAVVLGWFLITPAMNWYGAIQVGHSNPRLSIVPQPLAETTRSQSSGEKIAKFGYEFEVPWHKAEANIEREWVAVYGFSNGAHVAFMDWARVRHSNEQHEKLEKAVLAQIASTLGAHSQYELLSSELEITPNDVSSLFWTKKSRREALLLNFKNILFLGQDISAVYFIDLNGTPGFQIGNPAKDRSVRLRWFDPSEHDMRLSFAVPGNTHLSQQDINCVIQSIHRIQSAESTVGAGSHQ